MLAHGLGRYNPSWVEGLEAGDCPSHRICSQNANSGRKQGPARKSQSPPSEDCFLQQDTNHLLDVLEPSQRHHHPETKCSDTLAYGRWFTFKPHCVHIACPRTFHERERGEEEEGRPLLPAPPLPLMLCRLCSPREFLGGPGATRGAQR